MNVPQLKVDNCIQNNASGIVNVTPKSATLGSLHSDRPKVMLKNFLVFELLILIFFYFFRELENVVL